MIVTHNMQQAARVAERTAFFSLDVTDGKRTGVLVEYDDTEKLFTRPADKRTQDYVTGRFRVTAVLPDARLDDVPARLTRPDGQGMNSGTSSSATDSEAPRRRDPAATGAGGWLARLTRSSPAGSLSLLPSAALRARSS